MDQAGTETHHELAAREGLGRRLATHPSIAPAQRSHVGRVAVIAAVLAVLTLLAATSRYTPLAFVTGVPLLMCLFAMATYGRAAGRNEGSQLVLYERGLVIAHGGSPRVVRYADTTVLQDVVRRTRYGQTLAVIHRYTVTDTTGTKLTLSGGFANPEEWGPRLQQGATEAQLPGAVEELRAGRRLDFGPVWLTATEVGVGRRSVPWGEVEDVSVKDGSVNIHIAGQRRPLFVGSVPFIRNFYLFRLLAERLRG